MEQNDLDRKFEAIKAGMAEAAKQCNFAVAAAVAKDQGLIEKKEQGKPSVQWELSAEDLTLSFSWRFYDQSRPFSVQPDMNVMLLRLTQGERVIRESEQRYED